MNDRCRKNLINIKNKIGLESTIKVVGGVKNYIKILYGGDIKKYYQENGIKPYHITSEPNLYIDDLIVQGLDLPNFSYMGKNHKKLGDFSWVSRGIRYKFNAELRYTEYASGIKQWRVVGRSGDFGFGYWWITKRNTLGKRARTQIFQQIIEKYNLETYK